MLDCLFSLCMRVKGVPTVKPTVTVVFPLMFEKVTDGLRGNYECMIENSLF